MLIYKQLVKDTSLMFLGVFGVLIAIVATSSFSGLLDQVAQGMLTLSVVSKLMIVQALLWVGYFLPQCFYISLLLVLLRWYRELQMTIIFASGVSRVRVLGCVLLMSTFVAFLSMVFNCTIVPYASGVKHVLRIQMYDQLSLQKLNPKQFLHQGDGFVLYSGYRNGVNSPPHDVYAIKKDTQNQEKNTWLVVHGKSLCNQLSQDSSSSFFVFHHGWFENVSFSPAQAKVTRFVKMGINPPFSKKVSLPWPDSATMSELEKSAGHNVAALIELYWRFTMPISIVIISVWSFALSYSPPRQNRTWVIGVAVLFYLLYVEALYLVRSRLVHADHASPTWFWLIHCLAAVVALCFWWNSFGAPIRLFFPERS